MNLHHENIGDGTYVEVDFYCNEKHRIFWNFEVQQANISDMIYHPRQQFTLDKRFVNKEMVV